MQHEVLCKYNTHASMIQNLFIVYAELYTKYSIPNCV